jgi:hypothetical protein
MESEETRLRLAQRPEAPWAHVAGVLGGLGAAGMSMRDLFASSSGTAAFEVIYVPLVAALVGLLTGIWGLALGHVVARLRGRVAEPWLAFWVALAAAAGMPLAVAWGAWGGAL